MTDEQTLAAERTADGEFLPGHSVRSTGMVGGAARAERIAIFLEPKIQAILEKALELAIKGDPRSMELVLKYYAPIARPDAERVTIPGYANAKTLEEKADAVIAAAASGHCSAEAAAKLLGVLRDYAQTITASDHEKRLQVIEEGRNARVIEALPIDDDSPESVA